MASTGGRYSVVTKGPLTGAIACSNSGGYFGAELRYAGWDMIIFEGKSPKAGVPVRRERRAELCDASGLWGKKLLETEEKIKSMHQDPQIRVSSIGLAGENQVMYAASSTTCTERPAARAVGAVMGSKNLKPWHCAGTKGMSNIAKPDEFMKVTAEKEEDSRGQRRSRARVCRSSARRC